MKTALNPIAIEVTNRCNMKCLMCVSHGAELYEGQADEDPPYMDVDFFRSIIDQYVAMEPDVMKGVVPQFQGEPMLHPKFLELCEYLQKKDVRFGFTTNASLLKPEIVRELLKFRWFNNITFSLDGLSKDTYTQIRVGANYEKVIGNIESFIEMARGSRYKVQTTVSYTEQPMNESETEDFIKHWAEKVDVVSINHVAVHGRPIKVLWRPERIACGDLWNFMIILTDGKVVPCCRDYLYKFDVGNLKDQTLEQVWYGPKYESLRRLHLEKQWDRIPLCNDCDTWMCRTERREVEYLDDGKVKVTVGPFFKVAERTAKALEPCVNWDWRDPAKWTPQVNGASVMRVTGGLELSTNGDGITYQAVANLPELKRDNWYVLTGVIEFDRKSSIRVGVLTADGSKFLALNEPNGQGPVAFSASFHVEASDGVKVVFCNNQERSQKVRVRELMISHPPYWDRTLPPGDDLIQNVMSRVKSERSH